MGSKSNAELLVILVCPLPSAFILQISKLHACGARSVENQIWLSSGDQAGVTSNLASEMSELAPEMSEIAFEATIGWGWFPHLLADAGVAAHMAHPLATRAIATPLVKNDGINARTLAHLLRTQLLLEAWIAPPEVRQARRLVGNSPSRAACSARGRVPLLRAIRRGAAVAAAPRHRVALASTALLPPGGKRGARADRRRGTLRRSISCELARCRW